MHALHLPHERVVVVRALAGAVAAIVLVDAVSVGAPGLGLLAVPFVAVAMLYRRGTTIGSAAVATLCAFYAVLGINYALGAGLDAPVADLAFAYIGTPLALVAVVLAVRQGQLAHLAA